MQRYAFFTFPARYFTIIPKNLAVCRKTCTFAALIHFTLQTMVCELKRILLLILIPMIGALPLPARKTTNNYEARQLFDKVYNMVLGPQGSTLHYDVNIISLYKTSGTIWYKGKKQRFTDERVDTWNDGTTAYMVYRKKKTIEIHEANSDKKDKYSGKFKFELDDFDYSLSRQTDETIIILKQRKGAKGTVKEARITIDPKTLYPRHLKIKVAFIWANISISNFKS